VGTADSGTHEKSHALFFGLLLVLVFIQSFHFVGLTLLRMAAVAAAIEAAAVEGLLAPHTAETHGPETTAAVVSVEPTDKLAALSVADNQGVGADNDEEEEEDDDEGAGGAGAGDKKKKKKKKNKKKGGAKKEAVVISAVAETTGTERPHSRLLGGFTDYYCAYGQTNPPTKTVASLFPQGGFPVGQLQPHGTTKYRVPER
jgi:hypothetical protein